MIAGWVRWLRAGGQLDEWADNTHAEVLFASQALLLQPTSQVLNLGCGWGRHALALANAGLRVIGLERRSDLLALAQDTGQKMSLPVRWVLGSLDDLILSEPVDAIVLFHENPLSLTSGPAEALFVLEQYHSLMRERGRLLFGSSDWVADPPQHQQTRTQTFDGTETLCRQFDSHNRTVNVHTYTQARDGTRQELAHRFWHPTMDQMGSLLSSAGFNVQGRFNSFTFLPFEAGLPGLIWLAQKR